MGIIIIKKEAGREGGKERRRKSRHKLRKGKGKEKEGRKEGDESSSPSSKSFECSEAALGRQEGGRDSESASNPTAITHTHLLPSLRACLPLLRCDVGALTISSSNSHLAHSSSTLLSECMLPLHSFAYLYLSLYLQLYGCLLLLFWSGHLFAVCWMLCSGSF